MRALFCEFEAITGVSPMRQKMQTSRRTNKIPRASEDLLTVRQVAENWRLSERTIRRMIADGRLRVVRLGRSIRIPPEASAT
jgi:excisionase family DNA binding protein